MSSNGNPPTDGEEPASPQGGDPGEVEGPGVLGSLPRSRPSVRSPRRARSAPKPGPEAGERAGPEAQAASAEKVSKASPQSPPEPAADEGEKQHTADSGGPEADLERLARAGLSVAGGAAALGLRAAGRAAAALRDAVERR